MNKKLRLLIAGEPFEPYLSGEPQMLLADEDMVNNRLLITLTDWTVMVNNGWRTKLDSSDNELREVVNAISKYLDEDPPPPQR